MLQEKKKELIKQKKEKKGERLIREASKQLFYIYSNEVIQD